MKDPLTITAWLESAGFPDDVRHSHFTPHTFMRYEQVPAESLVPPREPGGPRGLSPGRALIYRCDVTGAERRWGLE